jgi:predicted Ser/Thr protein kinase
MSSPTPPTPPPAQQTLPFSPEAPAANGDLSVPDRFGSFEIVCEIGRGGMGVVFKARERGLNRVVALKMILPGHLASPEDRERFQREAQATAILQHPNIVTILSVGQIDERHYYSMDYIEGPSLSQRLAEGPLPCKATARYVAILARAMHHAHQHGILHRDLKPSNILIDDADQPHITDFGLAKQLRGEAGKTRTGAILGTPGYMSPEQAEGRKDLGPESDVYGLGAILYECLTGKPPFQADSPLDTILQVLDREPTPPRELRPDIDRDLETVCLKCLAKDPRDRYPSALKLAEDLERYLAGESIEASSLNMMDRLARTLERSHLDVEFYGWANMLQLFALIIVVEQVIMYFLLLHRQPWSWLVVTRVGQFVAMGVVFWWYRRGRLLPRSQAERQLFSIWIGYLLACTFIAEAHRQVNGTERMFETTLYPLWAVISGLGFFCMGSTYWGWCYAIGLGFMVLSVLMPLRLEWAPLEFGALWALTLSSIGTHLKRISREQIAES